MDQIADTAASPWHDGERAAQAKIGMGTKMEPIGQRAIRPFMPDQHRDFFAQLPFLVVGSVDDDSWPWASIIGGQPGFALSPDPQTLRIAALPMAGDPLRVALRLGTRLGLLGIELPTRRRNRMNGRVTALDASGFTVGVDQSFGNCPQYVRVRSYDPAAVLPPTLNAHRIDRFTGLDAEASALIGRTETSFVASSAANEDSDASHGVDVSHRGGPAAFLTIGADGAITVPDYSGNRFFNTLGNLLINPRAGLLIPDFAGGDLLQIAGMTEIVWEGPEVAAIEGAQRIWRLTPRHGRWLRGALPLMFRNFEPSD